MKFIKNWLRKRHAEKIIRKCGCVCFCECGDTLNDQTCIKVEDGVYLYSCRCGKETSFDFVSYPVPVKISIS